MTDEELYDKIFLAVLSSGGSTDLTAHPEICVERAEKLYVLYKSNKKKIFGPSDKIYRKS